MSRYVVHFTGTVVIDAENAAQAAKQAKKYRVIGRAIGAEWGKGRDPVMFERGDVTLKMGLPMRVSTSTRSTQKGE
jgi:hypothetical protein